MVDDGLTRCQLIGGRAVRADYRACHHRCLVLIAGGTLSTEHPAVSVLTVRSGLQPIARWDATPASRGPGTHERDDRSIASGGIPHTARGEAQDLLSR